MDNIIYVCVCVQGQKLHQTEVFANDNSAALNEKVQLPAVSE